MQPIVPMGFCFYIQPVKMMGFFFYPYKRKGWNFIIKDGKLKPRAKGSERMGKIIPLTQLTAQQMKPEQKMLGGNL